MEYLESSVNNYKEDYELFFIFFKNDIIDKLTEIQANIKTETCAANVLNKKVKILERDNKDLRLKMDKLEEMNNDKMKFKCKFCKKIFTRETYLDRHKMHGSAIPQMDGFNDNYD